MENYTFGKDMQHLQPGSCLQGGKYRIERVLGQGGFGITYLAEQQMLGRQVTVKEFFMKGLCDRGGESCLVTVPSSGSVELVERFRQKFLKEAGVIAKMNHRHIVPVYDIFEENGTAYYVMEFLDGGSLDDMVKGGAMPEDVALKFVREVAEALGYVHERKVLHLDVKPQNLLMRQDGEVVLIDFGISKQYDDEGGQTSTTPVGISKGYAPVEQYNQGVTNFSPATDIYSLGATMYKLLTGKTPPEASLLLDDEVELVRPKDVSFRTWTALEKAMEPRRKHRPQSIAEFLSLLDASDPVTAPREEARLAVHEAPASAPAQKDVPVKAVPQSEETLVEGQEAPAEGTFTVNGVSFRMIPVGGGSFEMKETVECGFLGLSTKVIVQPTTVSDYQIGETPVTQALWKAVMGKNPSENQGDNLPVECVSWLDCLEFIEKLNGITGKTFRLPTEAEWEFAARGGNKDVQKNFGGNDDIGEIAWYRNNSDYQTHPVATKKPNVFGIYDMIGNVNEWCQDVYGNYSSKAVDNPTGPEDGSARVCRGGSYGGERYCDSSSRSSQSPYRKFDSIGFRLAMSK